MVWTHNESQLKLSLVIQTSLNYWQSSLAQKPIKISNGNDGNIVIQLAGIHDIKPPLAKSLSVLGTNFCLL
jgi:hypothetical protein